MSELFIKVYKWMIDMGLKGADLMVYAFLYTMNERNHTVRGQKYISENTGICLDQVGRALRRLRDLGLVDSISGSTANSSRQFVVTTKSRYDKMSELTRQNVGIDTTKCRIESDKMSEPLIGNKRYNERYKERYNKKSQVAHSRSLDEIAAETLVSLSLPSYPNLMESILGFIDHRKKMKKPLTDRAITLNIKKAHKLSDGDPAKMTDLFNLAVERGWQGIYPEKENTKGGKFNANDTEDDEPFFKPTD